VIECLPRNQESPSSNPSAAKNKQKKQETLTIWEDTIRKFSENDAGKENH
jgi:hypothetical protein